MVTIWISNHQKVFCFPFDDVIVTNAGQKEYGKKMVKKNTLTR